MTCPNCQALQARLDELEHDLFLDAFDSLPKQKVLPSGERKTLARVYELLKHAGIAETGTLISMISRLVEDREKYRASSQLHQEASQFWSKECEKMHEKALRSGLDLSSNKRPTPSRRLILRAGLRT